MAKKSTNSNKENPYFQKLGLNQGFPKYCSTSHPVCSFFGHGNLNNKSGNILLNHCKERNGKCAFLEQKCFNQDWGNK